MGKRLFVWIATAFIIALPTHAQGNSYSMVIEMTNGTKINIGPDDIKSISFIDGKLALQGESIEDIKKEIASLNDKIEKTQTPNLNNVYAAIEALQAQIANLNTQTTNLQTQNYALQTQVAALTEEVSALKKQVTENNSDNNGNNNQNDANYLAKLVGVWQNPYDNLGVIGIKFTADGKAYYNEWSNGQQPNFDNVVSPASVAVTANTLRITHPMVSGYFEEYHYTLSNDGNAITFTLVDWAKDKHNLNGTFTKIQN